MTLSVEIVLQPTDVWWNQAQKSQWWGCFMVGYGDAALDLGGGKEKCP